MYFSIANMPTWIKYGKIRDSHYVFGWKRVIKIACKMKYIFIIVTFVQ